MLLFEVVLSWTVSSVWYFILTPSGTASARSERLMFWKDYRPCYKCQNALVSLPVISFWKTVAVHSRSPNNRHAQLNYLSNGSLSSWALLKGTRGAQLWKGNQLYTQIKRMLTLEKTFWRKIGNSNRGYFLFRWTSLIVADVRPRVIINSRTIFELAYLKFKFCSPSSLEP